MTQKLRNWAFPIWTGFLLLLIVSGLVGAYRVLTQGLVITNLTDLVPWGLWIGIDLSSIALAAGAFLLSAGVYLLKKDDLQPIARTAVFIGFLGYTMAMMTLLMDIGRPDRFWHALVYWNIHSPLWEVTMCVALYFTVLTLEILPIIGNASFIKSRWPRLSHSMGWVHVLAPILAVLGLLLSLMHQSSLGATYGILAARPFWYKSSLAVLFLVSAMAAGPSMTLFASRTAALFTSRAYIENWRLNKVAYFIGWVLIVLLYLRIWDTLSMVYTHQPGRDEAFHMLTSGPYAFNFWGLEMLIGIIIPAVILLNGKLRHSPAQWLALLCVIIGLIAYRWDTNMVGQLVVFSYLPEQSTALFTGYKPSLVEWQVGLGVISFGLLGFTIGVRYFHVVDHRLVEHTHEEHEAAPVLAHATD